MSASVLTPFFIRVLCRPSLACCCCCSSTKEGNPAFDWNFRFENQVIRKAFPDAIFIINFELEVNNLRNVPGRSQMILYVEM